MAAIRERTTKTGKRLTRTARPTRATRETESDDGSRYLYDANGDPAFVLVPVNCYQHLVSCANTFKGTSVFDDPSMEWIDARDAGIEIAAHWITQERIAKGLTQKQLADKLKMPQSQISRIERNPDRTTVRTLKKIAKALGVDVSALIR